MIAESLFDEIEKGREGCNQGYSLGLNKLEDLTDGLTKSTYTLLFASSGVGKINYGFLNKYIILLNIYILIVKYI